MEINYLTSVPQKLTQRILVLIFWGIKVIIIFLITELHFSPL